MVQKFQFPYCTRTLSAAYATIASHFPLSMYGNFAFPFRTAHTPILYYSHLVSCTTYGHLNSLNADSAILTQLPHLQVPTLYLLHTQKLKFLFYTFKFKITCSRNSCTFFRYNLPPPPAFNPTPQSSLKGFISRKKSMTSTKTRTPSVAHLQLCSTALLTRYVH